MTQKKKFIIGNWKSNLNSGEINLWFETFYSKYSHKLYASTEIIICAPFVYLSLAKKLIDKYSLPIKLGAQNVSPFGSGAYTGEISALMLAEFVDYVIIGHSERRQKFAENEKILKEKVERASEQKIKIIYCIPDEKTIVPDRVDFIAYEPVWAIGTGKSDNPENADRVGFSYKQKKNCIFIYGGSVNADNIQSFLNKKNIDGALPGKASLDPGIFWEMIINASKAN